MTQSNSFRPRVVYSRGAGCAELAEILAGDDAERVTGDVAEDCRRHRADLLVARKLTGFDLVSTAVPVDFDPDTVSAVVAPVAGGPHSVLAAQTASIIADSLSVPAKMVSLHRDDEEAARAERAVTETSAEVPEIDYELVEVASFRNVQEYLEGDPLLVFGAPGGSFFNRQLFGTGARLRSKAPGGAVMVRQSPERVFQRMGPPVFVAALREAADAMALHPEDALAVADDSRLVGVVRRHELATAGPGVTVGSVMESPVSIGVDDPLSYATEVFEKFGDSPLPVVDEQGRLVGSLTLDEPGSASERAS